MNVVPLFEDFHRPDVPLPLKSFAVTMQGIMPETAIKKTIQITGLEEQTDKLFALYPGVYKAFIKLSTIITREYPDRYGNSILASVLVKLVNVFEADTSSGDFKLILANLYAVIIDSVNDITAYMVKGLLQSGDILTWEPLSEPITNWIKRENIIELQWFEHDWFGHKKSPEEIRWLRHLLASRLFSFGEMTMLNESGVICG